MVRIIANATKMAKPRDTDRIRIVALTAPSETSSICLAKTRTSGSATVTAIPNKNPVAMIKPAFFVLGSFLPIISPMGNSPALTPIRKRKKPVLTKRTPIRNWIIASKGILMNTACRRMTTMVTGRIAAATSLKVSLTFSIERPSSFLFFIPIPCESLDKLLIYS